MVLSEDPSSARSPPPIRGRPRRQHKKKGDSLRSSIRFLSYGTFSTDHIEGLVGIVRRFPRVLHARNKRGREFVRAER